MSSKKPTQREVVELLCTKVGTERKDNQTYLVFKCPSPACKLGANKNIIFKYKAGFSNPHKHILSCLVGNNQDELDKIYSDNLKLKSTQGTLLNNQHFTPRVKTSSEHHEIYDWIDLIISKLLPLSAVEDNHYRKFGKKTNNIGKKKLKQIICNIVELVEKKIQLEMEQAGQGSILHDGWSKFSVHYIGLFACYMKAVNIQKGIKVMKEEEPTLVLLSCAPMPEISDDPFDPNTSNDNDGNNINDNNDEGNDATKFNAEVHANYISNTLSEYYKTNVDNWVVCQTADNAAVNRRTARLLKIPHIPCKNHLLNSEVNVMINSDTALEATIDKVHQTFKDIKGSLKNMAVLRKLTIYVPVLYNKTRWSGKYYMFRQYMRMKNELNEANDDEESEFTYDNRAAFRNKIEKYTNIMKAINIPTKHLQTKLLPLSDCRLHLDMLLDDIQEQKHDTEKDLYNCKLGNIYIGKDSEKLPDKFFENGIVKIQCGDISELTDDEHNACQRLCYENIEVNRTITNYDESNMTYEERIASKKKQKMAKSKKYYDASFILGSAAEVERLWSTANRILDGHRNRTSPLLFEAMLFLHYNRRFWDLDTVIKAIDMQISQRIQARLDEEEDVITME